MRELSDQQIIKSWGKNARPWVTAIREGEIESRVLVTNKAIIEAVVGRAPHSVLDVGCGEGWLVRELAKAGIDSLGIDVVPGLIESAQQAGGGRFRVLSYEELSPEALKEKFELLVCNFSLRGNESVSRLFRLAPSFLHEGGSLIVQTIHPVAGCGDAQYADGWREGSWAGFSNSFCNPPPWYFRTMETWKTLFTENGFSLNEIREPVHPRTQKPASVIFIGVLPG
ncbi:MAG: class I SAM-dependent methyltransferase [Ignavibacteriales bacterium]|nr:class I SAM-dependent methyltransferase [Ignavibacteriales bacterium]